MTDGVTLNLGSGGAVVDTETNSGRSNAQMQRVKIVLGAVDTDGGDVSSSNAMPMQSVASASGGCSSYFNASVTNSVQQVKGSSGSFYGMSIQNPNNTPVYLQLFASLSAGVTLGSTAPTLSFMIPAMVGVTPGVYDLVLSNEAKIAFASGISVAATSTVSGSSAPSSPVVANLWYQ